MKINLKKISIVSIVIINLISVNLGSKASVSTINDSPKYVVTEDEKFNKIFREGRDLIDKEEWKKAAEKFKEIACDCPEDKYVDAALYWLAFCYKKQKSFDEMDKTLDILLRNYPSSSWADDARVMKYEQLSAVATTVSRPTVARNFPADATATNLFSTTSQSSLDREDEIRLAAFQSLISANPKRAIEIMRDLIKADSKTSEALKLAVLRNLRFAGSSHYPAIDVYAIGETRSTKSDKQNLPLLRETLVSGYKNETNIKIKTEIIYTLGSMNDEESNNYIVQLYSSEENKELRKAVINTLAGTQFFTFAMSGPSNIPKNGNFDKLLDIIRTEKDLELRRLALSNLRRFSDWSAKNGVIDLLSQMYDTETNEEFKLTIIKTFSSSKQNQATMKLLDIAKNDKSDKMRLEAIRSLRTSDNPDVLKFLEDLIR